MFRRYRRHCFKAGIALLAVALAASVWLYSVQRNYQKEARESAYERAEAAVEIIGAGCIGLPDLARSECLIEALTAYRDGYRGEYDLYSQRAMALWTGAIGVVAVIGLPLTVIGVGLIYATFLETRHGAKAALITARTARRANQIMLNSGVADRRPWLKVWPLQIEVDRKNGVIWPKVHIENLGATPAIEMRIGIWSFMGIQQEKTIEQVVAETQELQDRLDVNVILLPGDRDARKIRTEVAGWQRAKESFDRLFKDVRDPFMSIHIVLGCVYRDRESRSPHHTFRAFYFNVPMRDGEDSLVTVRIPDDYGMSSSIT